MKVKIVKMHNKDTYVLKKHWNNHKYKKKIG